MNFVEINSPSDQFEIGIHSYLPREFQLKENELVGSENPYDKELESDLEDNDDFEIEESER